MVPFLLLLVSCLPELCSTLVLPHAPPALCSHARATVRMNADGSWSAADDEALSRHAARQAAAARLGKPGSVLQGITAAWVLIFNPGQQDEGVNENAQKIKRSQ